MKLRDAHYILEGIAADDDFCGNKGAGAIILAKSTGKILVSFRSKDVDQPHTWGVWGGITNKKETPIAGATREATEELGDFELIDSIPLYVFRDKKAGFVFHNFLFVVDKQFTPSPKRKEKWETEGHRWVEFGDWPKPLHFGLKDLIKDKVSMDKVKEYINKSE